MTTVLLYRSNLAVDGVSTWLLLLGRLLKEQGVNCADWFGTNKSSTLSLAEFEAVGVVTVGSLARLFRHLSGEPCRYDAVHVINHDQTTEVFGLLRRPPKLVVTSHGDLSATWGRHNGGAGRRGHP